MLSTISQVPKILKYQNQPMWYIYIKVCFRLKEEKCCFPSCIQYTQVYTKNKIFSHTNSLLYFSKKKYISLSIVLLLDFIRAWREFRFREMKVLHIPQKIYYNSERIDLCVCVNQKKKLAFEKYEKYNEKINNWYNSCFVQYLSVTIDNTCLAWIQHFSYHCPLILINFFYMNKM